MKDLPFEKALEKLEKIVEELERGDLSLDASLKRYEDGIKLARACQKKLSRAKEKVEILMKKEDGSLEGEPFEEADEKGRPG